MSSTVFPPARSVHAPAGDRRCSPRQILAPRGLILSILKINGTASFNHLLREGRMPFIGRVEERRPLRAVGLACDEQSRP
jgi:hypothetical protein